MRAQALLADETGAVPSPLPGGKTGAPPRLRVAPRATWALVDAAREASRPRLRHIAWPLAVSVGVHALALGAAWWMLSGSAGRGSPFVGPTLQATLATGARQFAVPEMPPQTVDGTRDVALPGATPAIVPSPLPPAPRPRMVGSAQGRAVIAPLDLATSAEPWLDKLAADLYPGTPRVVADFEVDPASVYPKAALADRRQANFTVAVVIGEDGRVELVPQTFNDPVFAPAVSASLAQAKARLPEGTPRGWALLTYMFEFIGEDAGK